MAHTSNEGESPGPPIREGKHWLKSTGESLEASGKQQYLTPGPEGGHMHGEQGVPNCRDGASDHLSSLDLPPKAQRPKRGMSREGRGNRGRGNRGRVVGIAGSGFQSVEYFSIKRLS